MRISFVRFSAIVALIAAALLFGANPAAAEKRVALVIGNSAYKPLSPLDNPKHDARLMADTLRALGFALIGDGPQLDLDKPTLEAALQNFSRQIQGADVALFYYAGHGVQVRGVNYLAPITANPMREADVDFHLIDANVVLRQMEHAGTKLNVLILDACRNNPLAGRGFRSVSRGLAQMQAPEGTLISYATQPGNVALDGNDGNSPYTKALARTIRQPGLDIFQTFNEVGLAVMQATGNSQQPWVSSSPIRGRFYFAGAPQTAAIGTPPAPPAQSLDPAERAWNAIKDTTSIAVLEAFLRDFSDSFYARFARARLEELKKSQVAVVAPPVVPPSPPTTQAQPAVGVFDQSRRPAPLTAAEERALKPTNTFKECDACPEMVVVPAGSFTMGSPASEPQRDSDEDPQRQVNFARPFAVGKFSVTFAEWDACVADGGCNGYRPSDSSWGRDRRPVINVSWDDAKTYLAWLSRRTGKTYRLLSESEREYVTRAGTTTPFWWGSSISPQQANYDGSVTPYAGGGSKGEYRQRTVPVDSFQPNPWGLYQVHGNVWEWTEDCWNGNYNGAPTDGSAWTSGDCSRRVLRGGSWYLNPRNLRSAIRSYITSTIRFNGFGFRVSRTLVTP